MATQKLPEPQSIINQATALAQLLGGTRSTANAGDIAPAQQALRGLQGQDYTAMLQAIFNKAGAQIPGIRQAFGGAIGARQRGNSAVQAALQKLMSETSTNAADQIAKLQAQNFATQANLANTIAGATKGTTQTQKTDVGGGLVNAAKLIAVLEGAKRLGADRLFKSLAQPAQLTQTQTAPQFTSANLPANIGEMPPANYGFASDAGATPDFAAFGPSLFSTIGAPAAPVDYGFNVENSGLGLQAGNYPPATDYQLGSYDFSIAPPATPIGLTYTPDTYIPDYVDPGTWEPDYSFADGGIVRAGGSRRSANPRVELQAPTRAAAQIGGLGLQAPTAQGDLTRRKSDQTALQGGTEPVARQGGAATDFNAGLQSFPGTGNFDSFNPTFSDMGSLGSTSTPWAGGTAARTISDVLRDVGSINMISGALGGQTLGKAGGALGLASGLLRAQTAEQAAKTLGLFAADVAVPGAGGAINFAIDPSIKTGVDLLTAFNPAGALTLGASRLLGTPSLGDIATNIYDELNPRTMMTPEQQGIVAAERAAGFPAGSAVSEGPSGFDAGSFDAGGFGGGFGGSFGGFDELSSFGDIGGFPVPETGGGFGGFSGFGGGGGGLLPHVQLADGGQVTGPGTGTSDSIPAKLSDGEYVMSADVVAALGQQFFDSLQAAFHTPVNRK